MRVNLFFLLVLFSTKLLAQTADPLRPPVDSLVIGDGVFEKVDVEATFSGGERAWRKYLEQTLILMCLWKTVLRLAFIQSLFSL
jgi:hypothetical protein